MKILVVTHDATLSGAPRVALLVARLLAGQGHRVSVLSRTDGPMIDQFAEVAPTRTEPAHRWRARLWRRAPRPVALSVDALLACVTLLRARPDLVYVNSSSAAIYARAARWTGRRASVLHVHESGVNTDFFLRRAGLRRPGPGIELVACSPSVQTELATLLERPASSITMLPSVPDDADVLRRSRGEASPAYRPDGLVVGCCGTAEHRKGVDLWATAAAQVRADLPDADVRFVWVGSDETDGHHLAPIELLGPTSSPYPHLQRFDVLVLPSRDDPFPLVVLESMLLGPPVVAFEVGAVREQIADTGILVPPEDTDALATAVTRLLVDEPERRRLGAAAAERAAAEFSTAAFAQRLQTVIEAVVGTVGADAPPQVVTVQAGAGTRAPSGTA